MMPREVEFVIEITPDDRYRRRHRSHKGRILNFVVQYETKIGDKWYPVVRYDTAHGFFHRDLMRLGKSVQKAPIPENDLNKAPNLGGRGY